MAKCIMVQGTMSGAGKSLLCAALCRIFRQDGYRAAPFKSQNMALNSFVTRDGLEMGRAQAVQAEAAGIEPDVRMNPVLLKPSSDTGSQVIVNGTARGHMKAAAYYGYRKALVPEVLAAYRSLAAEYDIIVIEGAGSPAEINLREGDFVNMGLAEMVDAPVLLAGDIDRGGVFAQLYGTVQLLSEKERARIGGMIINKFRGDPEILRPGLDRLEEMTGIPVLGVVPWLQVDIDEEDSLAPRLLNFGGKKRPAQSGTASGAEGAADDAADIAVIRLPRISNFTDFAPLEAHPRISLRYVDRRDRLGNADLVILPGTKSTLSDLKWLRETGLEAEILKKAAAGVPVLGICGGYQMLGERVDDPSGTEGGIRTLRGMGLLPCTTEFEPEKTLTRVSAVLSGGPLSGARAEGYEIHMGATEVRGEPFSILSGGAPEGCRNGNVSGTYLHGLFDSDEVTERLAAWLLKRKRDAAGGAESAAEDAAEPEHAGEAENAARPERRERAESWKEYRERQYDTLAAAVRAALDMEKIRGILR